MHPESSAGTWLTDTVAGIIRVPKNKLKKIQACVYELLSREGRRIRMQVVAKLAGLLMSVSQAVFPVRWCTRTLYRLIGVEV